MQSIGIFTDYLRRKINERRRVVDLMDAGDITQRQADILASLMNSDGPQNIYELSSVLGVSPQTIRNDLNALTGKGYVRQSSKDGHKQRFSYLGKKVGPKTRMQGPQ